jgi:putative ABC transport system substrate-binding protein
VVVTDGVSFDQRARIAGFPVEWHAPVMCKVRNFVDAGCLMSSGPDYADLPRRAASYVARILKGVKPANFPIDQRTKFELVVNLKTAKVLGLATPQSVLLRADRVIESIGAGPSAGSVAQCSRLRLRWRTTRSRVSVAELLMMGSR